MCQSYSIFPWCTDSVSLLKFPSPLYCLARRHPVSQVQTTLEEKNPASPFTNVSLAAEKGRKTWAWPAHPCLAQGTCC